MGCGRFRRPQQKALGVLPGLTFQDFSASDIERFADGLADVRCGLAAADPALYVDIGAGQRNLQAHGEFAP